MSWWKQKAQGKRPKREEDSSSQPPTPNQTPDIQPMSREITLSEVYSHVPILISGLSKINNTIKVEKTGIIENDCVQSRQDRIHIAQNNLIISLIIENNIALTSAIGATTLTIADKIQELQRKFTEDIIQVQEINNIKHKLTNEAIELLEGKIVKIENSIKENQELLNKDLIKGVTYSENNLRDLFTSKFDLLLERINQAAERAKEAKQAKTGTGIEDCCQDIKDLILKTQKVIEKQTKDTQEVIIGASSEVESQVAEVKGFISKLQTTTTSGTIIPTTNIEPLTSKLSNKFILYKENPSP